MILPVSCPAPASLLHALHHLLISHPPSPPAPAISRWSGSRWSGRRITELHKISVFSLCTIHDTPRIQNGEHWWYALLWEDCYVCGRLWRSWDVMYNSSYSYVTPLRAWIIRVGGAWNYGQQQRCNDEEDVAYNLMTNVGRVRVGGLWLLFLVCYHRTEVTINHRFMYGTVDGLWGLRLSVEKVGGCRVYIQWHTSAGFVYGRSLTTHVRLQPDSS
jgi:hypothetical protein